MSVDELNDKKFAELLLACQEIANAYPDGIVFIGGIAVYLHSINTDNVRLLAEFTHDADFYISLADMADLRDADEVISNRRLSKHQLIKRGFEFDIYTERHSALLVPYDQAMAHAIIYDNLRVASLEHLLALKLEAYRDRCSSRKGEKDAKDIIRLALVAGSPGKSIDLEICKAYLRDDHLALLKRISKGPEFLALAKGNSKEAKHFREEFKAIFDSLL